jgi:hypothetical protein
VTALQDYQRDPGRIEYADIGSTTAASIARRQDKSAAQGARMPLILGTGRDAWRSSFCASRSGGPRR